MKGIEGIEGMEERLKPATRPRHALLFELIRQRDVADTINRKMPGASGADSSQIEQFMLQATQSLTPHRTLSATL
ncbi:hypothetical protein [Roseovarius litorisediminis]|nr:hypothetical protein [Roseovarius litorisediminis]